MRRILSSVIQAQRSQTGFENKLFAPFYSQNKAKNFSTHIVCVWTSSSVHQCPLKSGILDTRITLDNHFRVIHVCFSRCFLHSKTSLSLLHVFRRLLQCCFAVKKCFVDYETWPRFPSACGWVDNELILVLGGTVPYKFQFPKKVVFFISHHTHQILTLWDCVGSAATQKHQYLILSWEFFQTGPLSFVCENNGSSLLNSTKSYLLETLNKPDSSLWIRLDKHNTVLD